MFTGIVQGMGRVTQAISSAGDLTLAIDPGPLAGYDVRTGDSVAVNGVCLTVVNQDLTSEWRFDVSQETLSRSLLGQLAAAQAVNLELALLPTTRLGGHFVSGHVDGIGRVVRIQPSARSKRVLLDAPPALVRYIAEKGSITVDGVSLTINTVSGNLFEVNIVPHTWYTTTMQYYREGCGVHLEVDLIARYLERLLSQQESAEDESREVIEPQEAEITRSFLSRQGFLPPDD
jgi:riboflavin synthase